MTSPCILKMCPQPASAPLIPKGHHGTRGTLGWEPGFFRRGIFGKGSGWTDVPGKILGSNQKIKPPEN